MDQSFGFTCELCCATPNPDPDTLEYVENSVLVDTGDWYSEQDEMDDFIGGEYSDGPPSPTDDANILF